MKALTPSDPRSAPRGGRHRAWLALAVTALLTSACSGDLPTGPSAAATATDGDKKQPATSAEPVDIADLGAAPVETGDLADIRGGFFKAGGLLVEFGFEIKTIVNGQELFRSFQLRNPGDSKNANLGAQTTTINGQNGGQTVVVQDLAKLNSTVLNSQNGANINNIVAMSITLHNHGNVVRNVTNGFNVANSPRIPQFLKDSINSAIAR